MEFRSKEFRVDRLDEVCSCPSAKPPRYLCVTSCRRAKDDRRMWVARTNVSAEPSARPVGQPELQQVSIKGPGVQHFQAFKAPRDKHQLVLRQCARQDASPRQIGFNTQHCRPPVVRHSRTLGNAVTGPMRQSCPTRRFGARLFTSALTMELRGRERQEAGLCPNPDVWPCIRHAACITRTTTSGVDSAVQSDACKQRIASAPRGNHDSAECGERLPTSGAQIRSRSCPY
jgi:hypothetical protein